MSSEITPGERIGITDGSMFYRRGYRLQPDLVAVFKKCTTRFGKHMIGDTRKPLHPDLTQGQDTRYPQVGYVTEAGVGDAALRGAVILVGADPNAAQALETQLLNDVNQQGTV